LERLVARFAGDEIAYDPTGAVANARALVAAGQALRSALAEKLFGLYYTPRQRTFVVALKPAGLATGDKIKIGTLAAVERTVADAMRTAFAAAPNDCPAIRVGFGLPQTDLVAIDRHSVAGWGARAARFIRRVWKPVTLAALFGAGMTGSAAARDPAVSQVNLKVTGLTGEVSGDGAWVFGGALTAPLGQYTGIQLEAGGGGLDGDTAWGGAAHIFTRDPDKYLLGLFAAYGKETDFDIDVTRVGAEAEIYMNQVSVLAQAGYQFSDKLDADTAFGTIDLRWYATDNLALTAGGSFAENSTEGHLEVEFMPGFSALPGLAFNVRGAIGDNDFDSILGGVTYYFRLEREPQGSPAQARSRLGALQPLPIGAAGKGAARGDLRSAHPTLTSRAGDRRRAWVASPAPFVFRRSARPSPASIWAPRPLKGRQACTLVQSQAGRPFRCREGRAVTQSPSHLTGSPTDEATIWR